MIKVVIFDADGLLTNQERFSVALEKDYGITIEKTLPFFNGPFQDCLVGKCDLKKIQKEEILFWDDTAGHIQGAKDFGIQTELYTSFEDFKEKMKQYMP